MGLIDVGGERREEAEEEVIGTPLPGKGGLPLLAATIAAGR